MITLLPLICAFCRQRLVSDSESVIVPADYEVGVLGGERRRKEPVPASLSSASNCSAEAALPCDDRFQARTVLECSNALRLASAGALVKRDREGGN